MRDCVMDRRVTQPKWLPHLPTLNSKVLFVYLFYFICHTIITKNIGKEEKKKWRGDLTETIGAYEKLGLLELGARAVSQQLKKRRRNTNAKYSVR